jgi:hypothetical protein
MKDLKDPKVKLAQLGPRDLRGRPDRPGQWDLEAITGTKGHKEFRETPGLVGNQE